MTGAGLDPPGLDLPVLPPLSVELVEARAAARSSLEAVRRGAAGAAVELHDALADRLAIESVAGVGPVASSPSGPLLLPPRRRHLTPDHERRFIVAAGALRSAAALRATSAAAGPPVVDDATVRVLHGVITSGDPEGTPGVLRTTASRWSRESRPVEHPPAGSVPDLLSGMCDMARRAPVDRSDVAAWLAFALMTVHPFADGNGRLARVVSALIGWSPDDGAATAGAGSRLATGVVETWMADKPAFVAALRAGQPRRPYRGTDRSAAPTIEHSARCEIAAADLGIARIGAIERLLDDPMSRGLDRAARVVLVGVLIDGVAPAVGFDEGGADAVSRLVAVGWLARRARRSADPLAVGPTVLVAGEALPPSTRRSVAELRSPGRTVDPAAVTPGGGRRT